MITDLGVLRPDPVSFELVLTGIYPGVPVARVREQTGWDLTVSEGLTEIPAPSRAELTALRELLATAPDAIPAPLSPGRSVAEGAT